jgi:hypothetical protein
MKLLIDMNLSPKWVLGLNVGWAAAGAILPITKTGVIQLIGEQFNYPVLSDSLNITNISHELFLYYFPIAAPGRTNAL